MEEVPSGVVVSNTEAKEEGLADESSETGNMILGQGHPTTPSCLISPAVVLLESTSSTAGKPLSPSHPKSDKTPLGRMINPPKLERKHSSGDLHSRLKTRKMLGVGETDNGDIHRSKISQVLGHNEHLYLKLPKGYWNWQAFLAALLGIQAGFVLIFPHSASQLGLVGVSFASNPVPSQYYAVTMLEILPADPTVVDLNRLGPHFYQSGLHLIALGTKDSEDIADILPEILQERLINIADLYSYTRGYRTSEIDLTTGNLMKEIHMDALEHNLYETSKKGAEELAAWLEN